MKSIDLKDILTYTFLSSPLYAPDGSKACFVAATANEKENCYERRLWLWDRKELRQLTSIGKEGTFLWDNDGSILFPAARSAAELEKQKNGEPFTAWYRLDLRGGEALPAFSFPLLCAGMKPLGDGKYAVLGIIDKHIPDYYQMTDTAREKVLSDRKADADYEVLDEIPFWGNGEGFTNGRRTALFLYDSAADSLTRITAPDENV